MPQYSHLWNNEFVKNTMFLDRHSLTTALEIGSYEGLTSNYIVDNLLSPTGTLTCIDPLSTDYELSEGDNEIFRGQYERFVENIEANKDRIWHIRKKSEDVLHVLRDNSYQFIYVDGHHRYNNVYFDFTEAFRLCTVSGYILCDDYLWNSATFEVKKAIDRVLEENPNHRLLLKLNQVLIQKLEPGSATENGQARYQRMSIEKLFTKDTIYASYANLDSRPDRNEKMIAELARVDLPIPFHRQRSFPWQELWDNFSEEEKERCMVMYNRTKGAIGCWYSQVEIMKEALRQGKHAWVNEDDLVFANDVPTRLNIIFEFLNTHEWDILFLGALYHIEPTWHKSVEGVHVHAEMKGFCHCNLNRDWEETNDHSIVRVFGAFSTHSWLINKDRIEHILMLLDRAMPKAIGIDWATILEQPNLNCFAFRPGCIKQFDSMSDISNGFARQSGFASLGAHWWQPSMNNY